VYCRDARVYPSLFASFVTYIEFEARKFGRIGEAWSQLTELRAALFVLLPLLVSGCSDYWPVPRTGSTFEAEAQRIANNLNKPVAQATPGAQQQPYGAAYSGTGGPQPYIIGQANNQELLQGLTDAPIGVDLRFNNADIAEVSRTVLGDVLKKPYVIDTTFRGTVSLRIDSTVSQRGLMDALRQSVEQAGGEIRRVGSAYEIASARPARIDEQRIAQLRAANASVSIVPLRFARASAVAEMLRAVYPGAGQITTDPSGNLIVIGGPAAERAQIAATAEALDIDGVSNQTVAVYRLARSNPRELADELKRVYGNDPGNPVEFFPLPRNNALLVVARRQSALTRVSQLIQNVDQRRGGEGRRMYVIRLQHARAPVLANVLREALGMPPSSLSTSSGSPGINPVSGQPVTMSVLPSASSPVSAPMPPGQVPPGGQALPTVSMPQDASALPWELDSVPLKIVPSSDNNSLLIFASADEFRLVQEAVRRLDSPPMQVLIQATIMDVTLNDRLQFGVQAFLQSVTSSGNIAQTGISALPGLNVIPTTAAFNFIFSSSGQVQSAINALRDVTTVTVLSAPQVVTQDNQRAKLEVGQQVPILTQTITQATVTNPSVLNTVSYVQTGVILTVTPRVNTSGGIDMDIRQEVTDVPDALLQNATPNLTPVLTRRVIETRVSVQSSQTVALGGLINEASRDQRQRVPLLGDIPVLGWLFGQTGVSRDKRELLVFLTPTAFSNPEEARTFTLELRRRIEALWQKEGSNRRSP
jgi:general secretion pathway protein D